MYLGGLSRTGEYDTAPAVYGTVKWKFKAYPGMTSSPVLAEGVLYFGSSVRLIAVDAENGEERWRFETDGFVRSSPAVSDGVVYVGSEDGHIYAVDAATGAEKWRFKTGDKVYSSPAISDGVVFVGSRDRHLYAIDVATGRERWRFQTSDISPGYVQGDLHLTRLLGVYSSPAVAGGAVYFGAHDGNLYSLDATSGQERWRLELGDPVITSPAIADGVLYIPDNTAGTGGILLAVDVETGREMWRVPLPGSATYVYGVAVSGGLAFVGTALALFTSSAGAYVHSVDIGARRHLWRTRVAVQIGVAPTSGTPIFNKASVFGVPSVAEDVVYIGNGQRNLHALLAQTGDLLWEVPTGNAVNSTPFVADGVVYFTSMDGYLYAVE
jgi:outer membrane protein assembly factor BamB